MQKKTNNCYKERHRQANQLADKFHSVDGEKIKTVFMVYLFSTVVVFTLFWSGANWPKKVLIILAISAVLVVFQFWRTSRMEKEAKKEMDAFMKASRKGAGK